MVRGPPIEATGRRATKQGGRTSVSRCTVTVRIDRTTPTGRLRNLAVVPRHERPAVANRVAVILGIEQVADLPVLERGALSGQPQSFVLGRREHMRASRLDDPHDLGDGAIGIEDVLQHVLGHEEIEVLSG